MTYGSIPGATHPGAALGVFFLLLCAAGCGEGGEIPCRVSADCASGICMADGRCGPFASADGGADGMTVMPFDGGPSMDAGNTIDGGAADSGPAADGGDGLCAPNMDGRIARREVISAAGLRATFRVAEDVTVSTAGEGEGTEGLTWDLSGDFEGDENVLVETREPGDSWYAEAFPGATYVSRLSQEDDLLGVFESTDTALLLRGVVSPDGGFGRTRLVYDPPVEVLAFPIEKGATWSTSSEVTGENAISPVLLYDEDYTSVADKTGTVKTPFGDFEVIRIQTTLTRTIGFSETTIRTYLFVAECFGTVASIRSEDNESNAELSSAAEVRRLAP